MTLLINLLASSAGFHQTLRMVVTQDTTRVLQILQLPAISEPAPDLVENLHHLSYTKSQIQFVVTTETKPLQCELNYWEMLSCWMIVQELSCREVAEELFSGGCRVSKVAFVSLLQ